MSKQNQSGMGRPVWAHSNGGEEDTRAMIVSFCAGRDVETVPPCDEALAFDDLATNEASTLALHRAGALSDSEAAQAAQALLYLREEMEKDYFQIDTRLEDIHINIEQLLARFAGAVAGKIHSGRSRNDQVACDIRLWHRGRVLEHLFEMAETVDVFLALALAEKSTVMPGFSHHQRAFITTLGHLFAAHAEAWLRDIERGVSLLSRINRCPLGAAAGFGTSWPLDRDLLADLLGFEGLIENSLDAVTSRLEVECDMAAWLALWMTHCGALAQDLILFSMEEFRWIRFAPEATTGSSIMPQKRNPDFAEVIKGKTALVHGALASLLSLGKGQPSGYHRDSQYSKQVGQDIWGEVFQIPAVLRVVLEGMTVNRDRMADATRGGFLEAAEWADAIAQTSGLPFREVYTAIGIAVDHAREEGRLSLETVNAALAECGLDFQANAGMAERLSSPLGLASNRQTQGSPNPSLVEEHAHRLTAALQSWKADLESAKERIAAKEAERSREVLRLSQLSGEVGS
jgi:argininosuccinate lyase